MAIGGADITSAGNLQIPPNNRLTAVRVIDVILSIDHPKAEELGYYDAIGTVFYSKLTSDSAPTNPDALKFARPLFSFIKNYPLKNEIVLILSTPGRGAKRISYYLPSISIWNHPHHNALPSAASFADINLNPDYNAAQNGLVYRNVEDESTEIILGDYFQERLNIKPLLPYEGDRIFEGRFGNSIRLGSTSKSPTPPPWSLNQSGNPGDPIIIVRNGQGGQDDKGWIPTVESINSDESSLYLTSTQKINIIVSSLHQQSYGAEELEPAIDVLTQVPVPPPPPEEEDVVIEEEETDEEEIIITEEEEEEVIVEQEPPPPAPPPEEPPLDELSPFDELLEDGDYTEEDFDEPEDIDVSGSDFEEYEADGSPKLDVSEVVENADDYVPNSNSAGSNDDNANNADATGDDSVADYIARGLVPSGAQPEAKPTSYPCTITSLQNTNDGTFQKYTLHKPLTVEQHAKMILSAKVNTSVKRLVVHTSAMPGSHIKLLHYFIREKMTYVKLTSQWTKKYHSGRCTKDEWDGFSSDKKDEIGIAIWEAERAAGGARAANAYKKYRIATKIAWTKPGYQNMIDAEGKCTAPYRADKGVKPGDDPTPYWGAPNIGNSKSVAISWLGYGNASKAGPKGMTAAQAHAIKVLISTYVKKYPDIVVYGHNSKSRKECPGFNVPKLCELMIADGTWGIKDKNVYKKVAHSDYNKGNYIANAINVYNDMKNPT